MVAVIVKYVSSRPALDKKGAVRGEQRRLLGVFGLLGFLFPFVKGHVGSGGFVAPKNTPYTFDDIIISALCRVFNRLF